MDYFTNPEIIIQVVQSMLPYKSIITINRKSKQAVYIQLANQLIVLIKNQVLTPRAQLPSTRTLAALINVHRKTVIASYEDLQMQGWIESIPQKGTYVHTDLPILIKNHLNLTEITKVNNKASFFFDEKSFLKLHEYTTRSDFIYINDGYSDVRLAPSEDISISYRRFMRKKSNLKLLTYSSPYGNLELRKVLTTYLAESRGLQLTEENILITRGSQMGIYLSAQLLLEKEDYIVIGTTNYISADLTFKDRKAKILRVTVDENGIDTREIALLCKKHQIKAIYVTPHHHHPTTTTLSAERRMHLLNLAFEYKFAIIEDDYDYDFHYNHAPILPLASHDSNGNVIYIGSLCKTVAPAYRIGYLIASKDFVDSCAKLRCNIDHQGDNILEFTFADFIKKGNLDRHIKKTLKIYKARRNVFCSLLQKELSAYLTFNIPNGGMAVWVTLNKNHSWEQVSTIARDYKLEIGDWSRYDSAKTNHNSIRIGFASYTIEELHELISKLKSTMNKLQNTDQPKL